MFKIVKKTVDLKSFMIESGVQFDRRGVMARCPFHDDHKPSLSVKNGHFRCFACGASGDVFDFAQKYYGLGRSEALRFVASRAGIKTRKITPAIRKEIKEITKRRVRRRDFFEWIHEARSRVAKEIRKIDRLCDILIKTPDDLGTWTAQHLYDKRTKLEQLDEILWGSDMEAILELYEERVLSERE